MKITDEIIKEVECMLDMRKKNGEEIWPDGTELEFKIPGTFAADKFIGNQEERTTGREQP